LLNLLGIQLNLGGLDALSAYNRLQDEMERVRDGLKPAASWASPCMKQNAATWDKALRALAGIAMIVCSVFAPLPLLVKVIALGGGGAYMMGSALFGTCMTRDPGFKPRPFSPTRRYWSSAVDTRISSESRATRAR
jgi:hypothetical protein